MRSNLILAASLALVLAAHGQPSRQAALTFNHLALSVTNLERSAQFYERVLRLREISRGTRAPGVRWFSLGEGKELHLISAEYYRGGVVTINKAVHLGLATSHFDGMLERLDAERVPYGNWTGTSRVVETRSDGVRQIFFQDPDGYWIEINSTGELRDDPGHRK
ncbi:MAG: VOC family protein [Gemmatimonadales bacterium]|nr:VOC family protein [Gemmatimonadales bacterium]